MLQLSLDWMKMDEAIKIVKELYDKIDIVEVGTPLIFDYGLDCVEKMKELFPQKIILADMKIMDAGRQETEMAVKKGADIITVMGAANNYTIQKAAEAAHESGRKIMVDVLGIQDITAKVKALDRMGTDYICVHTAFDMKDKSDRPLNELELVNELSSRWETAIGGGITLNEIHSVMRLEPDVVIVGGGILNQKNPKETIEKFYSLCGGRKEAN